jgi:hypothetical protein
MTNNEQQTAVEWLIEQLHRKYGGTDFFWTNMDEIEQAKEIDKERIINAWKAGDGKYDKVADKLAEQYYEQTYEGGNQ